MWGLIPSAVGRTQPALFARDPSTLDPSSDERHACTACEYLLHRMICGGADKVCLIIDAARSSLLEYFGNRFHGAELAYLVQPQPAGLCDAIFRAHPLIGADESVAIGLPDTIWFPDQGLAELPDDELAFLLFPVERPELFNAVLLDGHDRVREVRARDERPVTCWIWGACRMPASIFHALRALWLERECRDRGFGTLINAYLSRGGTALGRKEAHAYLDVGTLEGYRAAMAMLSVDADELPPLRSDTYI